MVITREDHISIFNGPLIIIFIFRKGKNVSRNADICGVLNCLLQEEVVSEEVISELFPKDWDEFSEGEKFIYDQIKYFIDDVDIRTADKCYDDQQRITLSSVIALLRNKDVDLITKVDIRGLLRNQSPPRY